MKLLIVIIELDHGSSSILPLVESEISVDSSALCRGKGEQLPVEKFAASFLDSPIDESLDVNCKDPTSF